MTDSGSIDYINRTTLKDRVKIYKKSPFSLLIFVLVILAAFITAAALFFLVGYILIKGIPFLRPEMFSPVYTSDNVSALPSIITTIYMIGITLLISCPLGIFCAIYLVEYSKKGNRIVQYIRLTTETLSGIPSIVYGLFGLLFFVTALNWRNSILAGSFTLAIMILPLIIRTTEEALIAVPDSFREASFGLGADRLKTIFKIVLPSAVAGILSGVILGIGRIVGESAALIFTAGTVAQIPTSLMDSGRTLSVHMYALSSEGLHTNEAYATAVILLVIVLLINAFASFTAKKISKL